MLCSYNKKYFTDTMVTKNVSSVMYSTRPFKQKLNFENRMQTSHKPLKTEKEKKKKKKRTSQMSKNYLMIYCINFNILHKYLHF